MKTWWCSKYDVDQAKYIPANINKYVYNLYIYMCINIYDYINISRLNYVISPIYGRFFPWNILNTYHPIPSPMKFLAAPRCQGGKALLQVTFDGGLAGPGRQVDGDLSITKGKLI
jgi:hypothetical protein